MLSQDAINKIRALTLNPKAEMISCIIPLGSVYWTDELPGPYKFLAFTEGADRDYVIQLFAIRINYWNTGEMSSEDQQLWNSALIEFPEWPLFQRLHLNEAEKSAHENVQNDAEAFFAGLANEADEFSTEQEEGGVTSFSATFNLSGEKPKWWRFWKR